MLKYLILFFTYTLINPTFACLITFYDKIIVINDGIKNPESIISKSNCSTNLNKKVSKNILSFEGTIKVKFLRNKNYISNKIIEVISLKKKIKNEFNIPSELHLSTIISLINKSILTLGLNDKIEYKCFNCQNTGQKSIKISFSDKNKGRHIYWFNFKLFQYSVALIAKKILPNNQMPLSKEQFFKKNIPENEHNNLFIDMENLNYYKLNKRIKKGEILKTSDITALTLVRAGKRVKIIINDRGLRLETSAVAKESGSIGQTISLFNPKSNKIIQGEIINNNLVMVKI